MNCFTIAKSRKVMVKYKNITHLGVTKILLKFLKSPIYRSSDEPVQ